MNPTDLQAAKDAVFVINEEIPQNAPKVTGHTFQKGQPVDWDALFASYATTGFQATNLGRAIEEVKKMLTWTAIDPDDGSRQRCKIFLGYTSNMISSGLREIICFLVKNKMVDVIVTSAGGIEEDFIKCLAPLFVGDFHLDGLTLRKKGLNRIGNLLMPNRNYVLFEEWLTPILDQMLLEQQTQNISWTPSKLISRLGREIANEDSVYYWAWKNDIPVFCPAITDGSLGDIMYFHSFKNEGLKIDLLEDLRALNGQALYAPHTGMIILGGGVVKHHICNANLMRNGANHAVFLNTGLEFDGSDSGASPDEAVSWGKIRVGANPVKVAADATLTFPILVAESFAKVERVGRD